MVAVEAGRGADALQVRARVGLGEADAGAALAGREPRQEACFCSSVPCIAIIRQASEWLPRIPATPIQPRASSSKTRANDTGSRSRPPYSSGTVIPKRPIAAIPATISVG